MRIVVDAMGSDTNPETDVAGAVLAIRETDITIILVGQEKLIHEQLKQHAYPTTCVEIVHAEEVITMSDKPSLVGKQKPNSSMHVGMSLVRDGKADAFVTAGNTGAGHAIAMLHTLKRIPGVKRPALSAIFPVFGQPVMFLDAGANTDSKAEWLEQYAIMGSIYSENVLGITNPRVGLLSNGEEEGKGDQLVLETTALLKELDLNFIGNVEPKDILNSGTDVVICDGFTGNIMIKTFEATGRYIAKILREEMTSNPVRLIGGLLSRGALRQVRNRVDTFEIGGAPLLGVNGIVIITHGSSDARAIKNTIMQAYRAVKGKTIEAITERIVVGSFSQDG